MQLLLRNTHIAVTDYTPGLLPNLENAFSVKQMVRRYFYKRVPVGCIYDEKSKEFRVFGGVNPFYLRGLTGVYPYRQIGSDPYDDISIRLTSIPRDVVQSKMIQFLIGGDDYPENAKATQISCNASTGLGKTFSAISAITYFRLKTMIITHRVNIKELWKKELLTFTDIDVRRIILLKPEDIYKIMNDPSLADKYYIYIVVHRTITQVANVKGWDYITEFFKTIKIGLKIYDEAHREFASTTRIDCYTNTFKTYYLTATMKLAEFDANTVFQKVFSTVPRFDEKKDLGMTDAKKHIILIAYHYNSHPSIEARAECKNKNRAGFNSKAHGMYQVEDDDHYFPGLFAFIDKFTVKKKLRTIIYNARIPGGIKIAEVLQNEYPDLKIGVYNSKVSADEKAEIVAGYDIIISTIESIGLGENIPDLRCEINTQAFRFDGTGDQVSGRLRPPKDGGKSIYIEFIDEGFPSILSQFKHREKLYKKIFGEIIHISAS